MLRTTAFRTIALGLLLTTSLVPGAPVPQAGVSVALAGDLFAIPAVQAIPTGLESPSEPPTAALCEAFYDVTCYNPAQIEAAYGTEALYSEGVTGAGETIAVVEPFGSPTIQADLSTFDQAFGLPDPPTFQIVTPAGAPPSYTGSPSEEAWAEETSLDVEWAHAMAPGAGIVLVETPIDETEGLAGFPQILYSENWLINNRLADVISQSFEATEQTFPSASVLHALSATYLDAYYHHVTVVSASGDNGVAGYADPETTTFYPSKVVQWPASDPLVTAVGGTAVDLDSSGNRIGPDVAWNDTYNPTVLTDFARTSPPEPFASGGGRSAVFGRPSYQDGVARVTHDSRGVPDISMNAACTGPVDIYSAAVGGWFISCGTSEAAPLFAGVVALADQWAGHDLGLVNPDLYRLGAEDAPGIVPIDQGNNTVSFPLTQTATTLTANAGTVTGDATMVEVRATASLASAPAPFGWPAEDSRATDDGALTANAATLTSTAGTVTLQGYSANGGYSLVTGLGTVDAAQLVPELAGLSGCPGEGPSPVWQWSPPWEQAPGGRGRSGCHPFGPTLPEGGPGHHDSRSDNGRRGLSTQYRPRPG